MEKLLSQIAITKIKGIGDSSAKALIAYLGSVEAIFAESDKALRSVPGIDQKASFILSGRAAAIEQAKLELEFVNKNELQTMFYLDANYPLRLKECEDAPLLLYSKANVDYNAAKAISIVGTRKCTPYGKEVTQNLVAGMAKYYPDVLIVSGLAYGIDVVAHRMALKKGLPTVGVMAHGLDHMYPAAHASVATRMMKHGGMLTEFPSQTRPIPENFARRNRIVAGLSDATIVVESAKRGGSLITTNIASSYNREVFAVPGRLGDEFSEGCNQLIKSNKAAVIEGVPDLEYILGWSRDENKKRSQQTRLMLDVLDEEQLVLDFLQKEGKLHINHISIVNKLPMSKLNSIMINLEFNGLVRCYPGGMYEVK